MRGVYKKVILIRPPRISSDRKYVSIQFPLNLAYLAGFLIKNGLEVEIWDLEVENLQEKISQKKKKKDVNHIFGITCITPLINKAHNISRIIKEEFSDVMVIVGGPHPTALPEETLLEFPNFDIVVIGEGEQTLLEICQRLSGGRDLGGVKGIAYRHNCDIKMEEARQVIDNLDSLPFPERSLLDINLYQGHHVSRGFSRYFLTISELITSRGCPYSCIFCSCHTGNLRFRSAENVLLEIDECVVKYNACHVTFMDDTFTLDVKRLFKICSGLKKFNLTFDCYGRVDNVNEELLQEMKDAGCEKISFGVESGSQRILNLIKKGITLEQICNAFKWTHKVGIRYVEGSFMIGCHPQETKEEIKQTLRLIKEIKPDILMLAITIPYPGTELYQIMKKEALFKEDVSWDDFTFSINNPSWHTQYISSQELVRLRNIILNRFYLSPLYILKRLIRIKNINELRYWLDVGTEFLKSITFGYIRG